MEKREQGQVYLDKEHMDKVKEMAKSKGLSVSSMLRQIVIDWLFLKGK